MRGRYQLLDCRRCGRFDTFNQAREAAKNPPASRIYLVRDLETGAVYNMALEHVKEPDSRRADLVDHAKDTLLWPYRGLGDE